MRTKVFIRLISFAIAFLTAISSITGFTAKATEQKSTLQSYVEAMQPGWNLGNTFDASGDETSWGNPTTTKEFIKTLAAQGYKSIRIPITWAHRMGDAPNYTVDKNFISRIKQIVDWSLDSNLYVMINMHHDSNWVFNMQTQHDEVLARYNALWTQISSQFKEYPNKLMFESINEPRFSDDWSKDDPKYFEMLDELNVSFHKIVRKSGGNNATRPLVLSTITAGTSQARMDELYKTISKLNDKNIIATFHYYGAWTFSVNVAGATTFDENAKNDIVQSFDRAYNTFASKGIPVIVGEYGLLGFDKSYNTIEHGEILKYFEYINYYAKEKKFPLMLWDNGQHFDRRALKWNDPELYQLGVPGNNVRSSNAETDSIYIKKDEPIKDINIKLNLNGNTLSEIKNGDTTLLKGTDYQLDNDKLIIKASFLQNVINKVLGKNATLTCKFSKGADWHINVINYDTPTLENVSALNGELTIPTKFNGDSLATMEATYESGGNAGPNDWTSFKMYNSDFIPSYTPSQIQITNNFFKSVKDGKLLLKMHFWSGNVVDYTIVKEGTKIVGKSSIDKSEDKATVESSSHNSASSKKSSSVIVYSVIGIISILAIAGGTIFCFRKKKK